MNQTTWLIIIEGIGILTMLICLAFYLGRRDKTIQELGQRMDNHEKHCNTRNKDLHRKIDSVKDDVTEIKSDVKVIQSRTP